jgi:hypothetical protein
VANEHEPINRRKRATSEVTLDPVTDQRIRELEQWRPHIERRVSDVMSKIDANTKITKDTNESVKDLVEFFTAAKVNAKVVLWITAVLGGIGGALAGVIVWLHR